ncbi:hypothetical protein [Ornithinimicrobium cavernae]|uniref:hypothetical protein n=1 Tax=Ornithinimicrobium cavernae TaxID=2666047 RepID=UPI000D69D243|nr:hypothetical protein [Ornithinimicrobium cavernae]
MRPRAREALGRLTGAAAGRRLDDPEPPWSPKPADTLTPHQQSLLVMGHLSEEQVSAYLRSSGLPADASRERAALHFAEHRVTALQEAAAFRERWQEWRQETQNPRVRGRSYDVGPPQLPGPAREELESGRAVGRAAGRGWQRLSTWSAVAGFVIGWGFLVCGVLGMVPGLQLLLVVSAVCLVASLLLLAVVAPALAARGERRARAALFGWAVHRPGQLERGLPGLRTRIDEQATVGSSFCLGLVSLAAGGFCAVMGLLLLVIALFDRQATTWQITGILLGLAAVLLLSPRLVTLWNRWVMHRNDAIDEAVSWVYAPATRPRRPV